MKTKYIALAAAILLLGTLVKSHATTIITDNYWGDPTGSSHPLNVGDVFDPDGQGPYDITHMDVDFDGINLDVTIHSGYFSSPDLASKTPSYAFGSLFLSTDGWDPDGDASNHYVTDNMITGTTWEYAINLADNGDAFLYTVLPGDPILGGDQRQLQEYQYVPLRTHVALGSWSLTPLTLSISMSLPEHVAELGLHWTMFCGNDVIEGGVSAVPEPGTFILLGIGLAGIAGFARKRLN